MMSYLKFLWNSKNEHRIHSPFVYELQMNVFKDGMYYYGFDYLAKYIESNPTSRKEKKKLRQIFRLTNHFKPKNTLVITDELTHHLLALSLPSKENKLTIFSNDSINKPFKKFNTQPTNSLSSFIHTTKNSFDFIFIDSCQQQFYLNKVTPFVNDDCVIIINEPHDKKDHEDNIFPDENFNVTIDLFNLGILTPKKTQIAEHFVLRS